MNGPLTSGMVGLPVTIEYDEGWDGLTKNLVCRCSSGADHGEYRAILNIGTTAVVAHEVMKAGMFLYLGIEGFRADGTLVIPTVWVRCGAIEKGANTGEDLSADPTLSVWAQLQTEIEQIRQNGVDLEHLAEIQSCVQAAGRASDEASVSARSAAASAAQAETAAARAEAAAGASDYPALTNKPSINGVELIGNMTAEELGIGQPTSEQISGAVSDWLDAHPEATATVGVRAIGEDKVQFGAVHGLLLDETLQGYLSDYDRLKLHTETAYGAYTQGQISADGTVDTTKTAQVSKPFRCYPREVLHLSKQLTEKIAYYTAEMEFISATATIAGVFEYTTPDNAHWYRLQNQYSYGAISLVTVRDKELKNRTFRDLVLSPIKCRPTICFTGDSNTYGYGLSSVEKSWANLFIAQLATIGELTYGPFSKWVRNCGAIGYSTGTNFKPGSYMEFVTDAENVTLKIGGNYDSTWTWYVDGITDAANDNAASLALDGNAHTVRVVFTGGQAVNPLFSITKHITCINKAVSGVSTQNMEVESGCDWLIVMIGTNHRTTNTPQFKMSLVEYSGRGSFVLPVPTHKVDPNYTLSLFQTIPPLTELFEGFGFEVVNCVPELSSVFSDTKYLQGDRIHFSEAGHVIICNTVSAKMGLPTYLSISE